MYLCLEICYLTLCSGKILKDNIKAFGTARKRQYQKMDFLGFIVAF